MKTGIIASVCIIVIGLVAVIAAQRAHKESYDPDIRATSMWGAVIADGEKENL